MTKTPSAFVTIGQGETVSGKLQKALNISATWTPTLYRQMVSRIADLNKDVPDINKVPAGTQLLVPQVPTVGKKLKPTFLSRFLGRNLKTGLAWAGYSVEQPQFSDQAKDQVAPQEEIQFFSVPLSQASSFKLDGDVVQGASGPVTVELAQGPAAAAATKVLPPSAASLIKAKLAAANGTSPVVVVVDDSVPDNAEYAKSKAFVLEMSRKIRETYGLGASPFYEDVKAQPDAMIVESASSLYPNLTTHASLIKQSLVEFSTLDPSGRVTVIYLPLSATQVGVAPLMREIVYLAQIIKIVNPPLPFEVTADFVQQAKAEKITRQILESNPDAFASGALMPLDGSSLSATTDSLYLEALGIVLSYYADAVRRPYALSFSWSAQRFVYPTVFEAGTYGIKFAAAGNARKSMPGMNFLQLRLEYASRAASAQDFVAVMNSTGTPATCPSNFFDDAGLSVASIAYPGEATSQYCGSSFSTPRAAWLWAARDAAMGQTLPLPVSQQGKLAWVAAQHNAILSIRRAGLADVFGRHSLDVEKYFSN